jgi:hypothetical protein
MYTLVSRVAPFIEISLKKLRIYFHSLIAFIRGTIFSNYFLLFYEDHKLWGSICCFCSLRSKYFHLVSHADNNHCNRFIVSGGTFLLMKLKLLSWQNDYVEIIYSLNTVGGGYQNISHKFVQLIFLSRWYLEHGLLDLQTCRLDELPILTWSPTFTSYIIWYSCQRNIFINCFKMWQI